MFRKILDQGQAGDNIGALLRGTKREEIERGRSSASPARSPAYEVQGGGLLPEEGRGWTPHPVLLGYRPQFYFRTTDVTGVANLPEGTRDGDAGRQRRNDDRADSADRHGPGPSVRDPRGRTHRRSGWLPTSSSSHRGRAESPPFRCQVAARQLQRHTTGRRPTSSRGGAPSAREGTRRKPTVSAITGQKSAFD